MTDETAAPEASPFTDRFMYENAVSVREAEEKDYESGPAARIAWYETVLGAIGDGMPNPERIARMALARPEGFLIQFND